MPARASTQSRRTVDTSPAILAILATRGAGIRRDRATPPPLVFSFPKKKSSRTVQLAHCILRVPGVLELDERKAWRAAGNPHIL